VKPSTATSAQALRASLRCALVDLVSNGRLGMPMPEPADGHVRRSFASNQYASRGSAAV
jgi:hypothetical protein